MRKGLTAALLLAGSPALSSCVAAVVPAIAASALGVSRVDGDDEVGEGKNSAQWEKVDLGNQNALAPLMVGAPASEGDLAIAGAARVITPPPPTGLGVGNDGPSPYRDLLAYSRQQAGSRGVNGEASAGTNGPAGAVLVPNVDLDRPETIACAGRPPAVIMDLDADGAPSLVDAGGLQPQPGLTRALDALRADDIRVIWISDLPQSIAPALRSILDISGVSSAADNDLLLLSRGSEDRKQLRRHQAAEEHCVLAIAGDDYADFDELYEYLLFPEAAAPLDAKFGDGWFLTPPPFVTSAAPADLVPTP